MKIRYNIIICVILVVTIQSCCKESNLAPSDILGEIKVELDANSNVLRTKETLIGNMICDGIKMELDKRGEIIDFVIMNGGAIRFNSNIRPNGKYSPGFFTSDMIDEMIPFENANVIVKVTGKELKSIFERSIAIYPLTSSGPFLQISKEIKIIIDTNNSPQVINELVTPPLIVSEGNRIISIKINDVEYDNEVNYILVVNSFMAEDLDNDGYVSFRNIPANRKENLGDDQAKTVKDYIKTNSPITPKIDGRIVYQ